MYAKIRRSRVVVADGGVAFRPYYVDHRAPTELAHVSQHVNLPFRSKPEAERFVTGKGWTLVTSWDDAVQMEFGLAGRKAI